MPDATPFDTAVLLDLLDRASPDAIGSVLEAWLRDVAAADGAELLIPDYQNRVLTLLASEQRAPVAGSAAGRALLEASPVLERDGRSLYLPVVAKGDVVAVLAAHFGDAGAAEVAIPACRAAARTAAYVVVVGRACSDVFSTARRRQPLSLPSEMQWELLPLRSYEDDGITVGGWLEPAYDVGGDAFDYSAGGGVLGVALIDAMGHGLASAMASTLALQCLRNGRRGGASLAVQAEAVNHALLDQHGGRRFCTALVGELELRSGRAAFVNAGHPPARVLRDGAVEAVRLAADVPLGLFGDRRYRVQEVQLRPGDRLVMVSDGSTEVRDEHGEPFGDARLDAALAAAAELPARAASHAIVAEVMQFTGDRLSDDVTVLCVDWQR